MAALSSDRLVRRWHQSMGPTAQKRAYATSDNFAASKTAYVGGVMMAVDGVARPLLSGSSLAALCLACDGADANGGIYVRALVPGVTLTLNGGTDQTLALTSITEGATIAIVIQLATTGTTVTTTGLVLSNFIRSHARLNELIQAEQQGTGASICAAKTATAVPHIEVLGECPERLETVVAAAAMTLRPGVVFNVGPYGMLPLSGSVPTKTGAMVSLVNDVEISKATDRLDFHAPLVAIESGLYYVDLARAR